METWRQRWGRPIYQPNNTRDHQHTTTEARRKAWSAFSLIRNQPCGHLDLGLLASRTEREYISVVEASSL